jgi:hypothetical protein
MKLESKGRMTRGGRRFRPAALMVAIALAGPAALTGQDTNILMPVDTIEKRLAYDHFEIIDRRGSRFEGDRTSRVALDFGSGGMLVAKWAPAPPGGHAFNNSPRYELAAYRIQELFLEPHEYVVPPTVARAFPLDWYRDLDARARPTFRGTGSVLVVLQYWLFNVTADGFWDRDRFAADTVYARHMGNFNVLTYLIRHNDQNEGNYLISSNSDNPRVFSVDNGLAFESEESDQGARWRRINVDRLPAGAIERLRALTEEDVTHLLATVAEFRVRDSGALAPVEPGPTLDGNTGVRHMGDVIQLGLTSWEIRGVWRRIQALLNDVDRGRYEVF